jgi:hypothetical protein
MNMDAAQEFRVRAEILHRHAQAGNVQALRRLKRFAADGQRVRRTECFAALAAELGFTGWLEAKRVLTGAPGENYGTLLYPAAGSGLPKSLVPRPGRGAKSAAITKRLAAGIPPSVFCGGAWFCRGAWPGS